MTTFDFNFSYVLLLYLVPDLKNSNMVLDQIQIYNLETGWLVEIP